jgi:hypothetical protein
LYSTVAIQMNLSHPPTIYHSYTTPLDTEESAEE